MVHGFGTIFMFFKSLIQLAVNSDALRPFYWTFFSVFYSRFTTSHSTTKCMPSVYQL